MIGTPGIDAGNAVELLQQHHQREFVLVKQVFSLMVLELWFRTFVDRSMGF